MPTSNEILALAPEIAITILAISVLLFDLFLGPRRSLLAYWSILGLLVVGGIALSLWDQDQMVFAGAFLRDKFSTFLDLIFLLATGIAFLMGTAYIREQGIEHGEYYALTLFATLGAMLMAGGGDLLIIFLGLEVLSLSLYVLSGFRRADPVSREAALKYFLLGAFASGFLLYGIALIFGATGTTLLGGIARQILVSGLFRDPLLLLGMGLLGVGLAFKVALVPFHMWTPDVYEGAPTPVAGYMSAVAKAAGFAATLRVFLIALRPLSGDWIVIFAALAILTMTAGNIIALAQTNLKRLLAYSSIAHAGYIFLGAIALNEWGMTSVLFYLGVYVVMNLGAFAVVIALRDGEREYLALDDYSGLASRKPLLALAMAVFMLSLAGVPPTAGFLAKFYLFGAVVQAGFGLLAIAAVLNTVLAAFYYLRVIVVMYMREPGGHSVPVRLAPSLALAIGLAAVATIQLGLLPGPALELAQASLFPFLGQ